MYLKSRPLCSDPPPRRVHGAVATWNACRLARGDIRIVCSDLSSHEFILLQEPGCVVGPALTDDDFAGTGYLFTPGACQLSLAILTRRSTFSIFDTSLHPYFTAVIGTSL